MDALVNAIKAAYNFFAGDAIILAAVVVAFGLGSVLAHVAHVSNVVLVVIFLVIIVGGLVTTLGRELAGRK